jgi:hypothetical protein
MTKKLEDYFKEFEDKVVSLEGTIEVEIIDDTILRTFDSTRPSIFKHFSLIKRFIKAQPLENQRDLWLTMIDLLNASKAFNNEKKEEIRKELLVDCFEALENLNNTILQSQTQKNTTGEGNSEKANKPDAKFNWQGTQAQLVYLIEKLYEQGFLSPISQAEKYSLIAQHFTVKGESLNPRNLAQAKQNSLNNKGGKPKGAEKIEQIISDAEKQNPSKT